MKLEEILDPDNLARHVATGMVAEVPHPTEPVRLYNYTNRCQFEGAWDHESRMCRGLIVGPGDEVLARPFPKFHNLYEHGPDSAAGPIKLEPPLQVFDKLDGSLGIAYRRPSDGALAWATRGSFTSSQAEWASAWWADMFPDRYPPDGVTWLAEIIYPENRIVLDYGDRSELVLLGGIDIASGAHLFDADWPGRIVECFPEVHDVTALDPNARPNAEGYVVLSDDGLTRVKLKADEYLRLHKLLTGVSNVTVWNLLANGDSLDALYDVVPDEFATWVRGTVAELRCAYDSVLADARRTFGRIAHHLPDRKAFAAEAVQSEHRALLFAMADDKSLAPLIWKQIKPERSLPYTVDVTA